LGIEGRTRGLISLPLHFEGTRRTWKTENGSRQTW